MRIMAFQYLGNGNSSGALMEQTCAQREHHDRTDKNRQRRILRSEIPRISAACHHVIRFAMACKITSCTFIARSQADSEYPLTLPPFSAGHCTQFRLQRTDHVLIQPHI